MENKKVHFRHLMYFYYKKGKNAVRVAKKICAVYGDDAVSERTVREWFTKFKDGDFNLEDRPRSGRPSAVDDDQIKALISNNHRITTREMAKRLKVSNSTIHAHLVRLGFVSRPKACGGVHVSASRGSPPGGSSVGGSQGSGLGSALNCGQGSPGASSGGGGGAGGNGGGGGSGGVSCVAADGSTGETSDWRGAHSIAALRRRASDASQQYSPQPPPPPGPPQYAHDLEYSSVY